MKVSIIIATHNGEKYLSEAIDSVLGQTFVDWELIIIDDASTDHTQQVISDYGNRDSRIISFRNEVNIERSASRNRGIKEAKGEYIAFLDDDDIWLPDKLQIQYDFLVKNFDYILCGTGANIINVYSKKISEQRNLLDNKEIRSKILSYNPFILSSICIRKAGIRGIYFNENINMAEDYEFILKVTGRGKVKNFPEYLVGYRVYENSSLKHPYKIRWNSIVAIFRFGRSFPNYYRSLILLLLLFFIPYSIVSIIGKTLPRNIKNLILP